MGDLCFYLLRVSFVRMRVPTTECFVLTAVSKKSSRLRLEGFRSLLNRVEEENNYISPALTFIFNEMFLFT